MQRRQILVWSLGMGLVFGVTLASMQAGPALWARLDEQQGLQVGQRVPPLSRILGFAFSGLVGGGIFGAAMGMMFARTAESAAQDPVELDWLAPEERVLRQGPASLFQGWINVGGWLLLTERRLVFRPHRVLQRYEPSEWELGTIVATETCWSGIVPNGLRLSCEDGTQARLVLGLNERTAWQDDIDEARAVARYGPPPAAAAE